MVKASEIIQQRIKELERELSAHEPTDFLSREVIEADIEKLQYLLDHEKELDS